MNSIAINFLSNLSQTNLTKFNRSGKQLAWRVRNSSKKGSTEVVNYFDKYPLFSSKYLDYLCWKEAHYLIINNQHRKIAGASGIIRIKELKEQMNSKRTFFNWDHLNNFYPK
jgi:hypothetical protein